MHAKSRAARKAATKLRRYTRQLQARSMYRSMKRIAERHGCRHPHTAFIDAVVAWKGIASGRYPYWDVFGAAYKLLPKDSQRVLPTLGEILRAKLEECDCGHEEPYDETPGLEYGVNGPYVGPQFLS